jgi:long-chain acyl-CoA synthetase
VVVPLDINLKREELEPLLNDCEARAIITSHRARQEKGEGLRKIEIKMEEFFNLKPTSSVPIAQVLEDELAAILYTSGTTGQSKGVMLTDKNIFSNMMGAEHRFKIGPGDNFLSVLPIHHTFETTCGFLTPFALGACITYAESLKSHNLLANMRETDVTIMCGVPLLYQLFYEGIIREVETKGPIVAGIFSLLMKAANIIPGRKLRKKLFPMIHKKLGNKTRFWISGGAAIDPEVIHGFALFGISIIQGYGLTESSPIIACNNEEENRVGSVGRSFPEVEIRISESGEILARGPNIMKGYYKRPDLTAEVLKSGWLHTGDIGYMDSDGYVYITGRSKDVIVTGSGMNVFPDEIEFKLNKIKGIKESAVIGSHVKEGIRSGTEEVWAVILPDFEFFEKQGVKERNEIEKSINNNIFALNEELAEYKRIVKIVIRDKDFPKTTTKKIKKYQLKKEMNLI